MIKKRGVLGETITWFVATLIIVFILVIAMVFSNLKTFVSKEITFSTDVDKTDYKNLFGYLALDNGGAYQNLVVDGNLVNQVWADSALRIFGVAYGCEVGKCMWFGVTDKKITLFKGDSENDFFGKEPSLTKGTLCWSNGICNEIIEHSESFIDLKEDKQATLFVTRDE